MPVITRLLLVCVITTLLACGGGSGGRAGRFDFGGVWQLRFNMIIDECGLLPEGALGFEDTQTITQTGDLISLLSAVLSPTPYEGELRSDDSLLAESLLQGDLFGDGIFCEFSESIAYNDPDDESSESIYSLRITCADGFDCVTSANGTAERQS